MYDDEMKEIVAQFKFRGCRVSAHFYRPFRSLFQKCFANVSTVIAVPLSKEREIERGFNQAELLATCLPVKISYPSLRRRETEKQSKKTRKERVSGSNPFIFREKRCFLGNIFYSLMTCIRQGLQLGKSEVCYMKEGQGKYLV